MKRIIRYILLFLLIFLLFLFLFSTSWTINTFTFYDFNEILFTIMNPMTGTSTEIINSYINDAFLPIIASSIILFSIVFLLIHYCTTKKVDFQIKIKDKNYHFDIKGSTLRKIIAIIMFVFAIGVEYYSLDKLLVFDYIKSQLTKSSFIEENYVDPKKVTITFPEKKRNLIYIFVESLESTYFSSDLGGESDVNYIAPLNDITLNNISFSDTNLLGGAQMVPGATFTSGAMVAQTSGLPLKQSLELSSLDNTMIPGATALGDILKENGYQQEIMFGSNKEFGNRGTYFTSHGDYNIFDYYTAIEKNKFDSGYHVWWGFEDAKLFEYAKEEILDMAKGKQPFNMTLLTADTHADDGYLEKDCSKIFDSAYGNSLYCSATYLASFIEWIQEQDFYDNTTIILVGDHVSMDTSMYSSNVKRRVYNLFINSSINEGKFHNRVFSTLDLFPTTLASLGVSIEGNRLGLGTNLFSDQPTLMEEYSSDYVCSELEKYSSYYVNKFIY